MVTNARRGPRSRRFLASRPAGSTLLIVLIALIVVAGVGSVAYFYFRKGDEQRVENIITQSVIRGPFEHVVLEQGLIESSGSVEIRCEVKAATSTGIKVLWVEEEGKQVRKGHRLIQLDS